MIHIDRNLNRPAIKVYTEAKAKALDGVTAVTKAEQELEKAIVFFTDTGNYKNEKKITKKKFTFKVYKNSDLASELETVFGKKCAYCESRFAHVTPKEVEHFRPKSEIDSGTGKLAPGYYWLAGEWHNLLVSCPDCNRSRKHSVPGQSARIKLGKGTQFPLKDETRRVRKHHGDISKEEPFRLLLNPCLENPENHLSFDENGLIHPRLNATGQPSAKGKASIDVYALQRKALVEERLIVLNKLKDKLDQLRNQVALRAHLNTPQGVAINEHQIEIISNDLSESMNQNAPYLGMLRDYIRRSKAAGEFDDLIERGIDPEALINR